MTNFIKYIKRKFTKKKFKKFFKYVVLKNTRYYLLVLKSLKVKDINLANLPTLIWILSIFIYLKR